MTENLILFQAFECVTVIFETFIVHQYAGGLFEKRYAEKSTFLLYALFCVGLMLLSLFFYEAIILTGYALVGLYLIVHCAYRASAASRIFSVFYFSAIMVGSEIFASGLISGIWGIDLSAALEPGLPRMLCIVVAKLLQLLLVKMSISVANWKTSMLSKGEAKLMLPLLLCQIFSIIISHYVFMIYLNINGSLEAVA